MAKKPIKPLIRALAEHIADDVMASHDAKYPRRKRLTTPANVYFGRTSVGSKYA